jgi:hypothetical protein
MAKKFDKPRVHRRIKKTCKKKGIKVSAKEINFIWKEYIKAKITEPLSTFAETRIEGMGKFIVKATPITKHRMAKTILEKNRMLKSGNLLEANRDLRTSKYIYKICFEPTNRRGEKDVYFKAHKNISKEVYKGITNSTILTRF